MEVFSFRDRPADTSLPGAPGVLVLLQMEVLMLQVNESLVF
jgi:hypothetical protein